MPFVCRLLCQGVYSSSSITVGCCSKCMSWETRSVSTVLKSTNLFFLVCGAVLSLQSELTMHWLPVAKRVVHAVVHTRIVSRADCCTTICLVSLQTHACCPMQQGNLPMLVAIFFLNTNAVSCTAMVMLTCLYGCAVQLHITERQSIPNLQAGASQGTSLPALIEFDSLKSLPQREYLQPHYESQQQLPGEGPTCQLALLIKNATCA